MVSGTGSCCHCVLYVPIIKCININPSLNNRNAPFGGTLGHLFLSQGPQGIPDSPENDRRDESFGREGGLGEG